MFLYQKVFENLKKQILSGEHPSGTLLPSEREIGEIYHVDRTTVRKAFQLLVEEKLVEKRAGKGTVVIHQTEEATPAPGPVLAAPPVLPSAPHQNGTIAFLLPKSNRNSDRITVPFYSQLFYSVEKNCRKLGFTLMYSTLDETDDLEDILSRNITNIVGIMFISNISEKHIDQAIRIGIPSILINSDSSKITSVAADNFTGTYTVCERLLQLGHRDICVLSGIEQYHSARERLRGVRHAMKDHGLALREKYIISGNSWEFEGGYEATASLLRTAEKLPTAIIAFNDRLASGAMQALQQAGLRVPDDVSIIGFDNSELAMYSMPKLSSVEINIPIMAKASVANLLYQIQTKEIIPVKILIPVTYIERASVKDLSAGLS